MITNIFGTNKWVCFDIETNGLDPTKIHIAGWWTYGMDNVCVTNDYKKIKQVVEKCDYIICHNGILFDAIAIRKLIGIDISHKIIDTLPLSWYLYPKRSSHSMESWAEELGRHKPEVSDWDNADYSVYVNRVTEDVKTQANMVTKMLSDLKTLYGAADEMNAIKYINNILYVYNRQYYSSFILDVDKTNLNIEVLNKKIYDIKTKLESLLPKIPVYTERSAPHVIYKKDGSLTSKAAEWYELLRENNVPHDTPKIKYISRYKEPNAGSSDQIKEWLFSLGWVPDLYKDSISVTGELVKVPQIKDKEGNLCASVLKIAESNKEVNLYTDLTTLISRVATLNRLLNNVREDGTIFQEIAGFTSTLRSRHKTIVNIPKVSAKYGKEIREVFTCLDDEVIVGCDIVSLESFTRSNWIYDIDTEYAVESVNPTFDPHLDLAVSSGKITKDDLNNYLNIKSLLKVNKELDEDVITWYNNIDKIRTSFKVVNYMSMYSAGPAKIKEELKCSIREAKYMHSAYWEKNRAIKLVAAEAPTKTLLDSTWIYNNITKMWNILRSEKDKFSALNQSLGSYIFYNWARKASDNGVNICVNMHDEIQCRVKKNDIERVKDILHKSMEEVNKEMNLHLPIQIDIKIGKNYANTH